ncbi:unnamed protein product [Brassicogethes aeneus]|uniref:Lipase n=1 Tax=Brassicogethes aeneus TaxID=1431903 RepID=A0A9P0BD65_BRAAE|nr:unnamed protein product [Brassicogethes aeneus]
MSYLHLIFTCLFVAFAKCEYENNVCPTYIDYINIRNNTDCWYNFAAVDKVPDIIKKSGYPFIEYKVQTRDGYILTVFRIPSVNKKKPAVFMLHGVQSSAGIFVGLGRSSLAFLLSDAGYDVWLGNYRGTEYSEGHTHLNASMREYWDYGVDEIALIDVPLMLRLVTHHSGYRGKIIYVGHSLGTTAAMMYASEFPMEARKTVQLFVWISPAYKLTHMRSPYRVVFPLFRTALRFSNHLNLVQVISRGYSSRLTRPTCLASPALMLLCLNVLNLFLGPFTEISPETIPVLLNQLPSGTSFKTLTYLSEAVKGNFKKFDYGGRNMMKYGTEEPPEYDVSKIDIPVILAYSAHDWATSKDDAMELYMTLSNHVRYGRIEINKLNFNHFDFLFGKNSRRLVAEPLIKMIEKFQIEKKRKF